VTVVDDLNDIFSEVPKLM